MDQRALLIEALELHRRGDTGAAERKYRSILAADPSNADAHHLLGLLLRQRGNVAAAVDYLIKACVVLPSNSRFLIDCADALHEYTFYEDAAAFYSLALKVEPDNAHIWFALGSAYHRAGNADAALGAMRKAIDIKPDFFEALCNCAELFRLHKDFPQALSCMQRALALRPDFPAGHNAVGQLYEAMSNTKKALLHYRQATLLNDSFAEAHNNLGNMLSATGEVEEAIASFKRALSIKADFFEPYYNLGNCLRDKNAMDEALEYFATAIKLKPQSVPAVSNYCEALMAVGRIAEAQRYLESIVTLAGEHGAAAFSNLLLCMNYNPVYTPGQIHAAHGRLKTVLPVQQRKHRLGNTADPHRMLRVGYVSADFCNHPVSRFIEPVLTHHDRKEFEVFCYGNLVRSDAVTKRLQALPLAWRYIYGVPDDHVERMIRDDRIDILIDLAGHTAGNRLPLFSKKPAPVQASYCGYPNTTGVGAIDYYLTDACLDTHEDEPLYIERLIRLPDCFCCYMPPPNIEPINDPPFLRNGFITFGSLHPLMRLNTRVLDVWSAVLRAVPSARLRIVRDTLMGRVHRRLTDEFKQRGIDPQRIDLECRIPPQGHFALFNDIDIVLDTFPWSGHTAACEALWMGVPVITLYGNRHAGRMAATILCAGGLQDWVAFSEEQYCAIAETASVSLDKLKLLRETLPRRMTESIVGNAPAFTRKLEVAYRTVWMQWCEKQSSSGLAASPLR